MKTIHKFALDLKDEQIVEMPAAAQLLTVQEQGGKLQLWAQVDTTWPAKPRRILIVGTGHPMPAAVGPYVATVQTGAYVWHVFDGGVA